jgi:hypothetical protein
LANESEVIAIRIGFNRIRAAYSSIIGGFEMVAVNNLKVANKSNTLPKVFTPVAPKAVDTNKGVPQSNNAIDFDLREFFKGVQLVEAPQKGMTLAEDEDAIYMRIPKVGVGHISKSGTGDNLVLTSGSPKPSSLCSRMGFTLSVFYYDYFNKKQR